NMQRAYGGAAALALSHQLGAPMELATPIAGIGAAAAPQLIKGIMGTQAWQSATAATRKAALNVLFSKGLKWRCGYWRVMWPAPYRETIKASSPGRAIRATARR